MADELLGGIAINEVLVDPNGSINYDTDGNGTAAATDEFVELVNTSGSAIDISGLELWDAGVGNWYTFPPSTVLEPGAHAMVLCGVQSGGSLPTGGADDLFFDAGRSSAAINNGGDNVVVYDPANDEFIQATFNGDAQDDPPNDYTGFSATATQVGSGEDLGNDTDGESLQRMYDTSDTWVSGGPTPGTGNICFAAGTMIATPEGPRPVERLVPGDTVTTLDRGPRPVVWNWAKPVTTEAMRADPRQAPIRIAAGAFGPGLPTRDLSVSRQHRMMLGGPIVSRMFGCPEVLVAAHRLLPLPGVSLARPSGPVSYVHLLLDSHEVVLAEGMPAESLYLGQEALAAIPPQETLRIAARLGCDPVAVAASAPPPVRPLAQGPRAARLIARHAKNARPPVSPPDAPDVSHPLAYSVSAFH